MKNQPIISVKNLKKSYGSLIAVNNIGFDVNNGEIFGILGPNGAGKTTTLEMMEGLKTIDDGSVTIDGINVSEKPDDVKSVIGVQLQSSSFFDNLNLTEMLTLFGKFYGEDVKPMALLKTVELESKKNSYIKHLSGGQRQRMSIACSLVNNPKVLFLDEPTTGLDPQARRHLWELIVELQEKQKRTIIITTHYMEEAEELCDRVAIMDEGEIIILDKPQTLIKTLLKNGFKPKKKKLDASLDDVFLDLTGKKLRE